MNKYNLEATTKKLINNAIVKEIMSLELAVELIDVVKKKAEEMAKRHHCRFVDNETPYERVPQGHPTIVDYFYHEEVRGTENSGVRNRG